MAKKSLQYVFLILVSSFLNIHCNADKDIMRNSEKCHRERSKYQRCFLINFSTCYIGEEMLKKSDDPTQNGSGGDKNGVDKCTYLIWMGFSVGVSEQCKLSTLSPECRPSGE
jgi:hypothetical protein